jgi:hypothetical protein
MRARIQENTGVSVAAEEADLLTLAGSDREAAIAGLTTGREFPFVIVEGVLACSGDFDLELIGEVVRSASMP